MVPAEPVSFKVARITFWIKNRSFWEVSKFLAAHEGDHILGKIAAKIYAVTIKGITHEVDPEQARTIIAKFSSPQLIELDMAYSRVKETLGKTKVSFTIPSPLPEPHWNHQPQGLAKLSPENRDLLARSLKMAQEELDNDALLTEKTLRYFEMFRHDYKDGLLETQKKVEEEEPLFKVKPERKFILSNEVHALWPIITNNLYVLHGKFGDTNLGLRYVSRKEVMALTNMYTSTLVREKYFCAMSIVSIDDRWCLAGTPVNPLALAFVESLTEGDIEEFYKIMVGIRNYAESLLSYVEAMPFTKMFRDFWDVNKLRKWWDEEFTGIPGTGAIPQNEFIDTFSKECIIEEGEIKRLSEEDRLAVQIAGLSKELAQSIQNRNSSTLKSRLNQINYMLFNEIPEMKETKDGAIHVPKESTNEELVAVGEDFIRGKKDFHDTMLDLMAKRKAVMQRSRYAPVPLPPIPDTLEDSYEGGSFYGTPADVKKMLDETKAKMDAKDAEVLNFSLDMVNNISQTRRRNMLRNGVDPYHETDQSEGFKIDS